MSLGNDDSQTPNPTAESAPTERAARRRSSILGAALLGAVALSASLVGVSTIAGAQDEPEVEQGTADLDDVTSVEDAVDVDDPAWAAFDECITDALGDDPFGEVDDEAELTDEEWEALEAQFEAADKACADLLPEAVKALDEAFEAYDQCLTDAGLDDATDAPVVFVEDSETGQSIQFGENGGSVTITGDSSGVSVVTDGDVSLLDDEAIEAAYEACDDLLPDDIFEIDDEFDMVDEYELDDMDDADEYELDEEADDDA